jgi:hypothetical protein
VPPQSVNDASLANPATAIALANVATPTPGYGVCPAPASVELGIQPGNGRGILAEIIRFLSEGGAPATLYDKLLNDWKLLTPTSLFKADVDFIGAGAPQILLTYDAPDEGGTLLILGCADGRYYNLYQAITGGGAPTVLAASDLNYDNRADVAFSSRTCTEVQGRQQCTYRTQVIAWKTESGRFVSLLNGPISSVDAPIVRDVDNDRVSEVVVRLTSTGTQETGPLRTGVNIYDWNGATYVLSIVQLDPPRFQIQVIQEADKNFARQNSKPAISLYQLALNDKNLRFWFNDEPAILNSYVLYRLLLLYAYTDDNELLPTFNAIVQTYPDATAAPVYVTLSQTFWNAFQVTNNLHSACQEVQSIIATRSEALRLLNRYGSHNPSYTAQDLCPF